MNNALIQKLLLIAAAGTDIGGGLFLVLSVFSDTKTVTLAAAFCCLLLADLFTNIRRTLGERQGHGGAASPHGTPQDQ